MSSDIDPAEAWAHAITVAMGDAGMSQRALGAAVGVSEQAVDQWLKKPRPPAPATVFAVEAALALEPGSTSRLLGYLPVNARDVRTVEDAIAHDAALTRKHRGALIDLYQQLRR